MRCNEKQNIINNSGNETETLDGDSNFTRKAERI